MDPGQIESLQNFCGDKSVQDQSVQVDGKPGIKNLYSFATVLHCKGCVYMSKPSTQDIDKITHASLAGPHKWGLYILDYTQMTHITTHWPHILQTKINMVLALMNVDKMC